MADTRQARARTEDLISSLACSGSNMTREMRRLTRLSEEALREASLSEWYSFMERLTRGQEDVLGNAFSLIGFEPLHNFYLGMKAFEKMHFSVSGI